jgi:hypothetical protein
MKKTFLLYIAIFTLVFVNGQSIIVGDTTTPGFYNACYVPEYRIEDTTYDNAVNHKVPFDIDGDNLNDLSIYSSFYYSNAGGPGPDFSYPVWSSGIILDTFTDAIIINSSYYLDTLSYGDTINRNSNWINGSAGFGFSINNYTVNDTWKNKNNFYVGLRIRKTSDTLYGWLKVRVQDYHTIFVEKFSFQSLNPRDTIISDLSSNIKVISQVKSNLKIFPNPFHDVTTIKTTIPLNNATLTLYNTFGQLVKQINNISGQTYSLLRDNMPIGLYFLRLTENNKTLMNEKIVITDL